MLPVALSEFSSHRVRLPRTSLSVCEDSLVESIEQTSEHRFHCLVVDLSLLDGTVVDFVVGELGTSTVYLGTGGQETILRT